MKKIHGYFGDIVNDIGKQQQTKIETSWNIKELEASRKDIILDIGKVAFANIQEIIQKLMDIQKIQPNRQLVAGAANHHKTSQNYKHQ